MKRLQIIFLLLFPIALFSQSWDIEVGSNYLLNGNQLQTLESEFTEDIESDSGTFSTQTILWRRREGPIYSTKASFSLGAGWTKEVIDRFSFRLGGGLFLRSLDRLDNFEPISREVTNEEIIENPDQSFGLLEYIGDCTNVIVSPADLGESNLTANYLTLNLSTIYELIDEVFSLSGGIEFRTQIFEPSQQAITWFTEEQLGERSCTFHRFEVHERYEYLSRINFAFNLGGIYRVNENWNIQLGVSRDLNNVFTDNSRGVFENDLRATELFLKVRYQF